MSRARRRDTEPELLVRREAFSRGLRYRVDAALPGMSRRRADLTFIGPRVAVFIDGCFWHSCPEHATVPKANNAWWVAKLQKNAERDRETDEHLRSIGWVALRFWEHQEASEVVDVVEATVNVRASRGRGT